MRVKTPLRGSTRLATALVLGGAMSLGTAAVAVAAPARNAVTPSSTAAAQLITAEAAGSAHLDTLPIPPFPRDAITRALARDPYPQAATDTR